MREDERIWAVKELLFDYVKSPSLRHIRDPHSVSRLAQQIVRRIDQGNSIWRKWDGQREVLLKSALGCWIPVDDLRDFLSHMPGPLLTRTDVAERLKAFEEEESQYPDEELQAGCLTLYGKEKAEGTELPAIIGLLWDHLDREDERIRLERQESYQQAREQDRIAREERLLSGADCNWTQLQKSLHWYCRANGRTYRLSPTKDKMWNLHRVNSVADDEEGVVIGKYRINRSQSGSADRLAGNFAPSRRRSFSAQPTPTHRRTKAELLATILLPNSVAAHDSKRDGTDARAEIFK
jgi:hypothetical protein